MKLFNTGGIVTFFLAGFVMWQILGCTNPLINRYNHYMDVENYESARVLLEEEISKDPRNHEIQFMLGNVHLKLKNYKEARDAFDSSLRISFKHNEEIKHLLEKHYRLEMASGTEAINTQDFENAVLYLEKAKEIKPERHEVYPVLGFSYTRISQYKKAFENYKQAIELDVRDVESIFALSELAFQRKDYLEATDYAKRALSVDKSFYPAQEILVYTGLELRDYEMAEQAFKAIPNDKRSKVLSKNYPFELFNQGEYDRALPHLEDLVKSNHDLDVTQALAETYYHLNDFDKTAEYYEILWSENPSNRDALMNIIHAYEMMGSNYKATEYREYLSNLNK
ncbi:MAG: tetratricopeptide repeat protein [Balneolales bacterium]